MSGRKNTLPPVLISPALSLATSTVSPVTVIDYLDNCAYQLNVTGGGSSGTFAVQGSLDYSPIAPSETVIDQGNWVALQLSGTPVISGSDDTILINLNQVPYRALRIAYTSTVGGAGTAEIYVMAKAV